MDIRAGYYVEGKRIGLHPNQAIARARELAFIHTDYTVEVWHRLTDGAQPVLAHTAYPPAWIAAADAHAAQMAAAGAADGERDRALDEASAA